MASGFGILVSDPSTDLNGAPVNKILMNTNNPFFKIDTQVKTSFQTITLIITTDPPEPASGHTYTQVYKFAHGYKYIPSTEVLYNVTTPPPGNPPIAVLYDQEAITLRQTTSFDYAILYAITDATYVYFYVDKYNNGGLGSANLLTGTNVLITVHVFVEDVGI